MNPKISIIIPTYEMHGSGDIFLRENLQSICDQTYTDFEVIVSDQSKSNIILDECEKFSERIKIVYIKNFYNKGNAPCNINCAIDHSLGKYIKVLFQDDLFCSNEALEKIVNAFETTKAKWLFNSFCHTADGKNYYRYMTPKWEGYLLQGNNLMGNPTNLSFVNEDNEYFDQSLDLCYDHEYYHRMRMRYGMPHIIPDTLVSTREHPNRSSQKVPYDIQCTYEGWCWDMIQSELDYIQKKHSEFCETNRYPDEN
jgi:glycosyltransferase involved in cell wall biosynthesis